MSLQNSSVVGIKCSDPRLPGRMYLAEKGGYTRRIQAAKFLDDSAVGAAIEEVKAYSSYVFVTEVVAANNLI